MSDLKLITNEINGLIALLCSGYHKHLFSSLPHLKVNSKVPTHESAEIFISIVSLESL